MTEFSYPSDQFPPQPGLTLTTPDGWTAIPAPGAAMAVRADAAPDTFAPNVLITVHRYLADFELSTALDGLRAELAEFEESRVEEPFAATFGEDPCVVVNTGVRHPEHGMLVQVHAYTSFGYGPVKDVIHVVGTCAGGRITEDYPLLQQVLESTRVTPGK